MTGAPKPELRISPAGESASLPAATLLSALKPDASYHEVRDSRHPLGIYNLSVSRICDKVGKCADHLYMYWADTRVSKSLEGEIIDSLELAMYSAAEHVDDIERVACSFFKTDKEASKAIELRTLKRAIKPLRDEISSFANTIKHAHGRIRIFETDFSHADTTIKLPGFFIEGFGGGRIMPNPILHSGGKVIISSTSYLWNILTFIGQASEETANFLRRIGAPQDNPDNIDQPTFRDAALKLTRLPLYSFDDVHPFERVKWIITMDKEMKAKAESSIYGSLACRWSKSNDGTLGQTRLLYGADGVTKSFALVQPKALRLQHWD